MMSPDMVVRPKIRLYDLFLQSPTAALELVLSEADATLWKYKTMNCSLLGSLGSTTYGSYKQISRKSLIGRSFKIEYWDGAISLFWIDRLLNEEWATIPERGHQFANEANLRPKDSLYTNEVHNYGTPEYRYEPHGFPTQRVMNNSKWPF